MTEQRTLLDVQDVTFSYGRLPVLFGIDLQVDPEEALALLGTNGAGKSTLLRVITGLEKPTGGRVIFDGDDITGLPAHEVVRRGLAMVPGGRATFTDMTVAENLEMQAFTILRDPSAWQRRRAAVLDVFPRLAERLNQRAGVLSGGEQQQLGLAKALLLEPRMLCIDELSLGLAPIAVEALLEAVSHINETGVSLLIVEQSLNIAAHLCERSVFLEKGQVRFEGCTRDLLTNDSIARAVFLGAS